MELTPAGLAFADADIAPRKRLFREAAMAHVPLLQQMGGCLANKADRAMPLEFFRDLLEEHLPEHEVERQLDTALNWGLYADLFSYDRQSGRIVLEQPAASPAAAPGPQ